MKVVQLTLKQRQAHVYGFSPTQRVFTDALMYDDAKAAIVNEAVRIILDRASQDALKEDIVVPKEFDLVIELVELAGKTVAGYYFADHATRLLFWTDQINALTTCGIKCVNLFSHLRERFFCGKCLLTKVACRAWD